MGNSATYVECFHSSMEFAFFPHARRRAHAEAMGVGTRQDAWRRIVAEAQEFAKDPYWKRADRVRDIGVILSKVFYRAEKRQYPL